MTSTEPQQSFWIGRDPAAGSRLPYLLRLPVSGEGRIFLGAGDTWPRGTDVFCFQPRRGRACGVTQVTALGDLSALVREGTLRVDGAGRRRRYRVA